MENFKVLKKIIGNQFFTATFIKKNGEIRIMNCRLGVKKHLKGGELSYDAEKLNHLIVFDVVKKAYRSINLNTLISITFKKETIKFVELEEIKK